MLRFDDFFERSETATAARSAVGDVEAKRILTFFSLNPLESILLLGRVMKSDGKKCANLGGGKYGLEESIFDQFHVMKSDGKKCANLGGDR